MQLTLLNDSGKFDGLDDTIRHVFAETAHKLNALFDLSQLDVTFSPFAEGGCARLGYRWLGHQHVSNRTPA